MSCEFADDLPRWRPNEQLAESRSTSTLAAEKSDAVSGIQADPVSRSDGCECIHNKS